MKHPLFFALSLISLCPFPDALPAGPAASLYFIRILPFPDSLCFFGFLLPSRFPAWSQRSHLPCSPHLSCVPSSCLRDDSFHEPLQSKRQGALPCSLSWIPVHFSLFSGFSFAFPFSRQFLQTPLKLNTLLCTSNPSRSRDSVDNGTSILIS